MLPWIVCPLADVQSFASPKQRKLDKQVDTLKEALEKIRVAAGGDGGKPNPEAASEAW